MTQAYLKCLGWYKLDVIDNASNGAIVNSASADMTHANIHLNMGQQQGLTSAIGYQTLFDRYKMVLEGDVDE